MKTAIIGEIEKAEIEGISLETLVKKADIDLMQELKNIDLYSTSDEETKNATELAYQIAINKIATIRNARQEILNKARLAAEEGAKLAASRNHGKSVARRPSSK